MHGVAVGVGHAPQVGVGVAHGAQVGVGVGQAPQVGVGVGQGQHPVGQLAVGDTVGVGDAPGVPPLSVRHRHPGRKSMLAVATNRIHMTTLFFMILPFLPETYGQCTISIANLARFFCKVKRVTQSHPFD